MRERAYAIVGGSRGMGWETARRLAAEGARVAIVSRKPHAAAAALVREFGGTALGFAADAAVAPEIGVALTQASAAIGPLRGLAVTNHWMGASRDFATLGDAEWDNYFQHGLMASVRACRAVLPAMVAEGGGAIVLTSAFSARAPKSYLPGYAAFKAALNNLTKTLAKGYGPQGVRVNTVAPGAIRTGRYDERMATLRAAQPDISRADAERQMLAAMDMRVALERIGEPGEVADMITFLLSERAAYTTGLIANIDGGTDF